MLKIGAESFPWVSRGSRASALMDWTERWLLLPED
jgi:hypothetical protein